jgi:hypothetical protein
MRPEREPREQAEQEERAARARGFRIGEAPSGARGAEQDQARQHERRRVERGGSAESNRK